MRQTRAIGYTSRGSPPQEEDVRMSEEEALRLASGPIDWDDGSRVHNWRNYVGNNVRRLWDTFTLEQKAAIIIDADFEAASEDWE